MGRIKVSPQHLSAWLRDESSGPMSMNPEHQDACNRLAASAQLIDDLVALIRHCWVHSGYRNCGRSQMGCDQGVMYDAIISSAVVAECDSLHVWELDDEYEEAVCKICGARDSIDVMSLGENGLEENGDDDDD